MDTYTFILALLIIGILWKLVKFFTSKKSNLNPFALDSRAVLKPLETDQKKRDSILKNGFKVEKVPRELDAVVIGSGIGGLAAAAILAKAGKKVLVLEQHDQAGGCCHTFIEKGYEFDVGLHYMGGFNYQSVSKTLVDQISDGQIQWETLSDDFDCVVFGKGNDDKQIIPIYSGTERQKKTLIKLFPEEEQAIERYYQLLDETKKYFESAIIVKFLPIWLVKILISLNLINKISGFFKMNEKSLKEVVDELTPNQSLRDIFCYCFLDYGVAPSETGFPLHSMLMNHFATGASYPVGGASEIAYNIVPVIEKSGGRVLVRAEVAEILLDKHNRARGVKVLHGKQEHQVFAPLVISDAGFNNTFERLLPANISNQWNSYPLNTKKRGMSAISVFVGMNASHEELEVAKKKNLWVFPQNNVDKLCVDYLNLDKAKVEDADIPVLFLSFPSTKDPSWEKRHPGRTTMAIVTGSNYNWFEEWEKEPCQKRGDEYEGLKKTIGWKMIEQAIALFPKIKDHIDYISIGTPLSNNFYLGVTKGEVYGMDHGQSRFDPLNFALLRPTTSVPGLLMTGQDVCSCGFTGALMGGLLCAQTALGRNVFKDLDNLHKCQLGPKMKGE